MAITWANGINGMLSEADWIDFPFNPSRPNEPIDTLFIDEQSDNLKAKWASIASEQLVPKMAKYHAFDTESNKTYRPIITNNEIEKGLIKVKINTSESLLEAIQNNVTKPESLVDYVLNDARNLAEQVKTRTLVAKYEIMATGKVTIGENNLSETIDFGVSASQKAYTIDLSNNSDIFATFEQIIDAAKKKGVIISGMMTSRTNITKMRQNSKVQIAINGSIGSGATVKRSTFDDYLATEFGITSIIEADGLYNPDNEALNGSTSQPVISTLRYYPENKITFFATMPNGRLGSGLWGVPPAVLNKMINEQASTNGRYIYIDQWTEHDPDVLWTRASGVFIPILINPDSLYIATVLPAASDEA